MKYTDHPVATVDEIRALLTRLFEMCEPEFMKAENDAFRQMELGSNRKAIRAYSDSRYLAFSSGVRYVIAQTGALREPSLVAPVVNLLWVGERFFDFEEHGHAYYACKDLEMAIRAGEPELEPLNLLALWSARGRGDASNTIKKSTSACSGG
jgi:hypothetical protein